MSEKLKNSIDPHYINFYFLCCAKFYQKGSLKVQLAITLTDCVKFFF